MANLLTGNNANFATTIGTWDEATNAGNFITTWNSADGGVLKAEVTTGGANIAVASHPATSDPTKIPVTPGWTLTCGAQCKQLSGTARNWRVEVNFYDSGGVNFSNLTPATGTLTVGSYATLSGVITVPANAVRCRLRVRWDTPAAGEIFYLDNAVVDNASAVNTGDTKRSVRTSTGWVLLREDWIS